MTLILWDLDRTLFNTQWFLEESDRALAQEFHVDADVLGDWIAAAAPTLFVQATDFDPEVLCNLISKRWKTLFPDSPSHPTTQSLIDVFLSEKRAKEAVYPDVPDALEWCKRDTNVLQSVFSQGKPSYQFWKLEKSGLATYFAMNHSRVTQHEKIDEIFFQQQCRTFEHVVIIDDKPSVVLGLLELEKKLHLTNLTPILIKRSDSQHAQHVIEKEALFHVMTAAEQISTVLKVIYED